MTSINAYALQGLKKISASIFFLNIFAPFLIIICFYLYDIKDLLDLSWIYFIINLSVCILSFLPLRSFFFNEYLHKNHLKKLLFSSSIPLWVSLICTQIINWSSQLILGAVSPPENVAYYTGALKISVLLSIFLIAFNIYVAPKFSELYAQKNIIGLKNLSKFSSKFMFLISIPIFYLLRFIHQI